MVSGLLPRGQNWFPGQSLTGQELDDVNTCACAVNRRLDEHLHGHPRASYLPHPDWAPHGQPRRDLLSRDGLHLSRLGQETLAGEITNAVESVKQVLRLNVFRLNV